MAADVCVPRREHSLPHVPSCSSLPADELAITIFPSLKRCFCGPGCAHALLLDAVQACAARPLLPDTGSTLPVRHRQQRASLLPASGAIDTQIS